jgi:ABC-2 type transport system ATP-binding protein
LTKSYGTARGVVELDLEVREGEVFGFLGPNGAGKTTTLRTLIDLLRPTSGSAEIFGLDCQRDSLAVRRRVGYLPGELALYAHLNGAELLAYLSAVRGGLDRTHAREHAERLAECLALDLTRRVRDLSHGNRQKLGLVQAFLGRPPLLILDEPTTGLDPLVQRELLRWIAEVRAEGRTVFLSSHVLPEVERSCDRVGVIRAGRLVAVETVAEIKARTVRRVELTVARPVEPVSVRAFESVAGVGELRVEGAHLTCVVRGSLDSLVKAAAAHEVVDVISRQPSLEETFLALYGEAPDVR